MEEQLLITTIGHLVSSGVFLIFAFLVLLQNPKKTLNQIFALSATLAAIFGIDFAVAINLDPSPLAHAVWMLNLVDIYIVATYLHFTFAALHKTKEARYLIWGTYAVGTFIALAALIFPQLFLPEVVPKLFTKSYLTAGPLYTVMLTYFVLVFFMALVAMLRGYVEQKDNRRQLEYFLFATMIGYSIGPIDFFLVYDIPVSPAYGIFFGFFMAPIAYGVLAGRLTDIRLVFKRAFFYSLGIGATAAVLTALVLLNDFLVQNVSWIQFWTVPILTAFAAFIIARIFYMKLVENERVKYEFITVATHKLRTPLTQISWGVRELLERQDIGDESRGMIEHVQRSANRLIELTNILFDTTEEGTKDYIYTKERVDLLEVTHAVLARLQPLTLNRTGTVNVHADEPAFVSADKRRITSVIEVLLENALTYTPGDGLVQIITYPKGRFVWYSVQDTGIGVSPGDRKRIFSRFYRTDAAKRADTEGVGLGLAMAKNIVEKHGGKIGVESAGEGKGSRFWFMLPRE